ncbi:MAG: glutamyl-tRNA reductase [Alphaproteobacteria bacterium]|nr:glutamyl-tRNA reductase [Alphaproteobacteria bacterium]
MPVDRTADTSSALTVVGVDHRSCPDSIRERIYVDDSELPGVLVTLKAAGAEEAMVLSTCDRVEVIGRFVDPARAAEITANALGQPIGLEGRLLLPLLYRYEGTEAIRHLFRVSSALDSQVVGEPQVFGQVKAAHRLAADLGAIGPVLAAALQAAYAVAKRVRTDTRVGEGAVSLAAAAVARVKELHGALDDRSALMIGAGELGLLVARQLRDNGLGDLTVLDRFAGRAAATAAEFDAHHGPLEELGPALDRADVVLAALGEGRYLITAEAMAEALKRRRHRPVFLLDLAAPGDIEPAVHRLDEAFVYDPDDLERITTEGRAGREIEAAKAEALVNEAVAAFGRDLAGRDAGPDIERLRAHIERGVRAALGDAAETEALAHRIAGRLAHAPSEALRRLAEQGRLDAATRALVDTLFGITDKDNEDQGA